MTHFAIHSGIHGATVVGVGIVVFTAPGHGILGLGTDLGMAQTTITLPFIMMVITEGQMLEIPYPDMGQIQVGLLDTTEVTAEAVLETAVNNLHKITVNQQEMTKALDR